MSETGNPVLPPTPPPAPAPPAPPAPTGTGGTFTQEDLNRIAATEKEQGKRAGQKELLESLGISDPEALKQILADHRALQEKGLSEQEKATKAALEREAKAGEAEQTAAELALTARIVIALVVAGVPPQMADRLHALVDVELDAEPEDIAKAVEQLKKDMPQVFQVPGTGTPRPAGDPVPTNVAPPHQMKRSDPGFKEGVKNILMARHPELKERKSS